ncbi:MAG: hypothetical protein GC159_19350 [Phycisphaera sp.]|nr:hypothetical protein [Phycisphaera sp.]
MQKSLDQKLARIHADKSCRDFILADAKDADMAFGLASPGKSPEHHSAEAKFRTLDEYRQIMRDITRQGLVDIMLMSASSNDVLTIQDGLYANSHVTPAVRANDTTDIWLAAGTGRYPTQPSRPFRTATIDHIMCGHADCAADERGRGADLGLYSITFNNDRDLDREALEHYAAFRLEAERKGFRHFLEVFDPNACGEHCPTDTGRFVADHVVRTLAGVAEAGRPIFLKIAYHGPAAMEALARYDSTIVPGILGGSAGTTYDAFYQLWEAKKYGARVALYGRKINNAECQLNFIKYLHAVANDEIAPDEAVRAYHATLAKLNIRPLRKLDEDLTLSSTASSYAGQTGKIGSGGAPAKRASVIGPTGKSANTDKNPDFSKMTNAEKIAWNRAKWNRILD